MRKMPYNFLLTLADQLDSALAFLGLSGWVRQPINIRMQLKLQHRYVSEVWDAWAQRRLYNPLEMPGWIYPRYDPCHMLPRAISARQHEALTQLKINWMRSLMLLEVAFMMQLRLRLFTKLRNLGCA